VCNSTLIVCVKTKAKVNFAQPPCGYTTLYRNIVAAKVACFPEIYEGWNFNSGNYLFTTDTK